MTSYIDQLTLNAVQKMARLNLQQQSAVEQVSTNM